MFWLLVLAQCSAAFLSAWVVFILAGGNPMTPQFRPVHLPPLPLLCVEHTLQSTLESGREARIVQIYYSAAFNRVNHQRILFTHCCVGVGGSVLSVLTHFLSNLSHHIMEDGCRSIPVDVVSEVPQRSVLCLLLLFLYTGTFLQTGEQALRLY